MHNADCSIEKYSIPFESKRMSDINTYSNLLSRHGVPNADEASYTAWVLAIQNATITCLNSKDDWVENQGLIQVKRMTANDLQSETTDHPHFTEDEYEQTLDVVRLPIAIPKESAQRAPDFLFIRPDDIALFRSITNDQWSILIGNPGISKSWFQWKFILFCYRQDLFELLRQKEVVADTAVSHIDIEHLSNQDTDDCDVRRKRSKFSPLILPKFILRTVNGVRSHWFALSRFEKVLAIRHTPEDLPLLTDASTTVLWEPSEGFNPIFSTDTECKIIATVSPNPVRYHGFAKNAIKFYMPCPSGLQIRLMGEIYRSFASGASIPDDDVIQTRVREYGPFIRIALATNLERVDEFATIRDLEINQVFSVPRDLSKILKSSHDLEKELKITNEVVIFSHRLARFVIQRDDAKIFGGYTFPMYRFSCAYVLSQIQKEIANADIGVVMNHLVAVNKGMKNFEDVIPYFLERVFELNALSGMHWRYTPLKLGTSGSIEWKDFHVKLESVNRTVTVFDEMKPGVLYYPSDRTFPLIDMYYKDSQNNLVCIQATMAKGHAKPISAYKEFFEIVLLSENVAVHLYYLTLPCRKDDFLSKSVSYDTFYDGVNSINMVEWNPNLSFYCLLPPDSFEREY
jgi:hypothetical protein